MSTGRAYRLTGRDVEMLAWMSRWRAVTAQQLATEFDRRDGTSRRREVFERRLRALHRMGYTARRRILADQPTVHWLTRAGMHTAGLSGAIPAPRIAELHHDLALVDLAHYVQARQPEQEVVTETEIRRAEPNPSAGPEAGLAALRADLEVSTARGTGGRSYPDLASIGDGGQVWVHELERSRKPGPRLEQLMLTYTWAPHINGAVYWTSPALIEGIRHAATVVNRGAEAAGLRPCIMVRQWPTPESARGAAPGSGTQ